MPKTDPVGGRTKEELIAWIKTLPESERANLAKLTMPRIELPYMRHVPHPGPQQLFLTLNHIPRLLYAGAAGSGKTDALLMAALQYVSVPGYSALIIRRSWPELSGPGGPMQRAEEWLSNTPAKKKEEGRKWIFPSAATLNFGYLQGPGDHYRYDGHEYQFIGIDEVIHVREESARYLDSRIRRPALKCQNCNGDLSRTSIKGQFQHAAGVAKKTKCKRPLPDAAVVMEYRPSEDGLTLFDVPLRTRYVSNPAPGWVRNMFVDPRTREADTLYIPAKMSDNPSIDQESYKKKLENLPYVERQRLLHGDWNIADPDNTFQREWFTVIGDVPSNVKARVRFWDMAATAKGDWCVGTLMSLLQDNRVVVEDVLRMRGKPREVESVVRQMAMVDGHEVAIRWEREPGSAGLMVADHYKRNVLSGWNADSIRVTGSKTSRAAALAAAAQSGNVALLTGPWNRAWLDEVISFPDGPHDDQVDSASGAFNFLCLTPKMRIIAAHRSYG